jgi:hypothetical protein
MTRETRYESRINVDWALVGRESESPGDKELFCLLVSMLTPLLMLMIVRAQQARRLHDATSTRHTQKSAAAVHVPSGPRQQESKELPATLKKS